MGVLFSELYQKDFEIHNIFTMKQSFWFRGCEFTMRTPRNTDAFIYFLDCEAVCTISENEKFEVHTGDFIHLAKGAKYNWKIVGDKPYSPVTLLFEYKLVDKNGEYIPTGDGVTLITAGDSNVYKLLMEKLINEFSRPQQFPVETKICAYSLLAEVIKRHRRQDIIKNTVSEDIYKGIKYLEDDINQNKSISEIAQMCHMSLSSFEKQFKIYSGVTPTEYRINKKLERAEVMLRSGTMTINQIAEHLGFYDGAYLCKLFKKKRGISPIAFRKIK